MIFGSVFRALLEMLRLKKKVVKIYPECMIFMIINCCLLKILVCSLNKDTPFSPNFMNVRFNLTSKIDMGEHNIYGGAALTYQASLLG